MSNHTIFFPRLIRGAVCEARAEYPLDSKLFQGMLQGSLPAELGHVTDCIYICRRFVSSYAKIDIHIVFMVARAV